MLRRLLNYLRSKRYLVRFVYIEETFWDEDEGVVALQREAKRYFNNYAEYADFEQTIDMAGECGDRIISVESKPYIVCDFFYGCACILFALRAWNFRIGKELFYKAINASFKGSLRTINGICYRFDNKTWKEVC